MLGNRYTNRHILMLQHVKNSKKNLCISLYIFSSKFGFSKGIWPKISKENALSSLFLQNLFFLCLVFIVWYDTICCYGVFISVNVNQNCEFYCEVAASQISSHTILDIDLSISLPLVLCCQSKCTRDKHYRESIEYNATVYIVAHQSHHLSWLLHLFAAFSLMGQPQTKPFWKERLHNAVSKRSLNCWYLSHRLPVWKYSPFSHVLFVQGW